MWKKYKIHAEQSEAENFLKKYIIRALKFIVLLRLNCTLGPPNLEVRGAQAPGAPLDPLVLRQNLHQTCFKVVLWDLSFKNLTQVV